MSNPKHNHTACFALHSACWARGENPDNGEDSVTDLLTYLRHYCRHAGIDYDACDRMAENHFTVEEGES